MKIEQNQENKEKNIGLFFFDLDRHRQTKGVKS